MAQALTYEMAVPLAELVHRIRPQWDVPGILAALEKAAAKGGISDVVLAAVDAALDPEASTPGVIPHRVGVYVPKAAQKPRTAPRTPGRVCGTCGLNQDECRARWHWDHPFETIDTVRSRRVAAADAYLPRPPRNLAAKYMDGKRVEDVELP